MNSLVTMILMHFSYGKDSPELTIMISILANYENTILIIYQRRKSILTLDSWSKTLSDSSIVSDPVPQLGVSKHPS